MPVNRSYIGPSSGGMPTHHTYSKRTPSGASFVGTLRAPQEPRTLAEVTCVARSGEDAARLVGSRSHVRHVTLIILRVGHRESERLLVPTVLPLVALVVEWPLL